MVRDHQFDALHVYPAERSTVLVLEDERFVRHAICKTLVAAGHTAFTARTAAQARLILTRTANPVRLLLADVMLPTENGLKLACELRMARPELKIILFSGHPDSVIARSTMTESRAPYLPKPFSASVLLEAVARALK